MKYRAHALGIAYQRRDDKVKVMMIRTYEVTVDSIQDLHDLAREWGEDVDFKVPLTITDGDDSTIAEVLCHTIDGGDLSSIGSVAGHSIIYVNPNI